MICKPAYRVVVMNVVPRNLGFSRTNTQRSAFSTLMRRAASSSLGFSARHSATASARNPYPGNHDLFRALPQRHRVERVHTVETVGGADISSFI
jgi:hypothetical protein